jgi:hypothetical protein
MVGQVHQELVAAGVQRGKERPLVAGLPHEPGALPGAVDEVHAVDRRMALEHVARVGIHQRVDLGVGRAIPEHVEHGRRKQHVAVVAELDHEDAVDGREVYGVGDQWDRMAPLGRRLGGSGRIIDFRMNILFATVAPLEQGPRARLPTLASARYRVLIPAQQLARLGHQVQLASLPPGGWPRQVVEAPATSSSSRRASTPTTRRSRSR